MVASPKPEVPTIVDKHDPWELPEISQNHGTPWKEMTSGERVRLILLGYILKLMALFSLLYLFICSLGLLSDSFRLLGGKTAGKVFQDSTLLKNPICGLMIGVLATVLLQSSSTSTSVVVSMVASQLLPVREAIPIIMGANIGTSMTNTLVSVAHSGNRNEFRRAFAGATVHDMFNWLSVIFLLPLEVITGYLYHMTLFIINKMDLSTSRDVKPPKLLSVLTDPLKKRIVQLDKAMIRKIAANAIPDDVEVSLIKRYCDKKPSLGLNSTDLNITANATNVHRVYCDHLFANTSLADATVGIILLTTALVVLCLVLFFIVKLLHSMLKGQVAVIIRKTMNNDLPGYFAWLTGYIAIVVAVILTIMVQSSSIFTSALTPLVGIGVLSLERMYPLTLGSNIGTTFTSVLAALASDPSSIRFSLQIALCHFFFNISGILLFFVVPIMRKPPVKLAKLLGNQTAEYRWFAVLYIFLMFFLLPSTVFGLSMASPFVLAGIGGPFLIIVFLVVMINVSQAKCRSKLPNKLQTWNFLPLWMRSLEPMDKVVTSVIKSFRKCFTKIGFKVTPVSENEPVRRKSDLSHRSLAKSVSIHLDTHHSPRASDSVMYSGLR